MNIKDLSSKTKDYIIDLIDNLAQTNFMISVARPAINMAIDNNFYKIDNLFSAISDKEGDINVDKLIDDTICIKWKKRSFARREDMSDSIWR